LTTNNQVVNGLPAANKASRKANACVRACTEHLDTGMRDLAPCHGVGSVEKNEQVNKAGRATDPQLSNALATRTKLLLIAPRSLVPLELIKPFATMTVLARPQTKHF